FVEVSWSKIEALQMIGMQTRLFNPVGLLMAFAMSKRLVRVRREEQLEIWRGKGKAAVDEDPDGLMFGDQGALADQLRNIHRPVKSFILRRAGGTQELIDGSLAKTEAIVSTDPAERELRKTTLADCREWLASARAYVATPALVSS